MLVTPNPVRTAKQTVALVIITVIAVSLIGDRIYQAWKTRQAVAAAVEPIQAKVERTDAAVKDGVKADEDRSRVDAGLTDGRNTFDHNYDKATQHEPETAARADRPVPDSVRNAFRERRLARERLGCIGGDCGKGPTDPGPAER